MDYQFWLITSIALLITSGIGLILSYLIKYFFNQILTRLDKLTDEIRLLRESKIMMDSNIQGLDKRLTEIEMWKHNVVDRALAILHFKQQDPE